MSSQGINSSSQGIISSQGINSSSQGINSASQGINSASQGINSASQGMNSASQGINSSSLAPASSPGKSLSSLGGLICFLYLLFDAWILKNQALLPLESALSPLLEQDLRLKVHADFTYRVGATTMTFLPRPDRVNDLLDPNNAQGLYPPDALLFVAKYTHSLLHRLRRYTDKLPVFRPSALSSNYNWPAKVCLGPMVQITLR